MTSGGIRLLYETEVEQLAVEHARKVLAYYDANIDSGQTSALHEVPFVFFGKMLTHEDDETNDVHTPSPVADQEESTEPEVEEGSLDSAHEVSGTEDQEDLEAMATQGIEEEPEDSLQDDFDELMHQPESSEESEKVAELSVVESTHDEAEEKSHVVNLDVNNSSQHSGSFSFDDVDEEDDFNTVSSSSAQSTTTISSQEDANEEPLEKERSSYVVDINSVSASVETEEDEIDVFGREDEDDLAALSDVTPPKEPVSVVEVPVEKHNAHEHVDNVSPNSSVVTNEWGLFDTEENLAAERKPVRRKTSRVNLDDIE